MPVTKELTMPVSPQQLALLAAARRALGVLDNICVPDISHLESDEAARDELRAALALFDASEARADPIKCPACGATTLQLVTVVSELRVETGYASFAAPDATANRNSLCCDQCGHSEFSDLGGEWPCGVILFNGPVHGEVAG